ncbi:MAG: transglycosylase SLT domain-containing protein [Candidatus Accumulibacter sp.]|jgi:hypothetical protein|nr:transglycosylase SLT domain-containing protein [Accumulibacter sp.]
MSHTLDAVSSTTQHIIMIAGLFLLLGVVAFVFKTPENSADAKSASPVADASVVGTVVVESVPALLGLVPMAAKTPVGGGAAAASKHHVAGVLEYVKRRYRVSPDAVLPVFEVAGLIGRERRIDPLLILAIIGVESGFNPFAESPMGARGLMQVIPRFHMDKVPEGMGVHHLFDPAVNIHVGVRVLEEAIRRRGGLTAGLQYYAGSSDASGSYANRVLAEKARLEKAAGRKAESGS